MSGSSWYDREALHQWLEGQGHREFSDTVRRLGRERIDPSTNADLNTWIAALDELPRPDACRLDLAEGRVRVTGTAEDESSLRETLMRFHPWRKGPFEFLSLSIDTEWRSDWKWDRVAPAIDLRDQSVLDVGCGNGYFGWRMLDAGARFVLGLDPILRYVMQFEVFHRYASSPHRHFVVPMVDTDLPPKLFLFDYAFSLGVLYHRTSPIDHLKTMAGTLREGGTLVLETLIIDDDQEQVLVPEDRYAQMRNVWFLPSIPMLNRWLKRCGFDSPRVVDVTPTTVHEQRTTDWMRFQSLSDFLDSADPGKTVEGYPGPLRATFIATRR